MTSTPDRSTSTPSLAVETSSDDLNRLRRQLERMTTYAHALEQRCNRLWTYVPDTHGNRDPAVPFVARHCEVVIDPGSEVS